MKANQKSAAAIASLGFLLLVGVMGCSNDNPSESTPELFTPTTGIPQVTAPLRIYSAQDAPMPSKGATLYGINVRMNLEGDPLRDFTKNDIDECLVTVSYGGQNLISGSALRTAAGANPCRSGEKADDLGVLLVGTTKKTGALTFSINMRGVDGTPILQGSTAALAVQPGGTVTGDLVALPVAK